MTERTVTVHLNAAVTRYLRNMKASEEQTARVRNELRGLDEEATHLTRAGLMSSIAGMPGLLSPLGAGMIALPGLAVTAAASFGALAVALNGTGDAIKAVNEGDPVKLAEAMAQLSTEARRFIEEYERIRPSLAMVGDANQDAFFKPLLGSFDQLTTAYLPTLLTQLPKLSAALGKAAAAEAKLLQRPDMVAKVNKQIALATELTQDWTRFLGAATEMVFDLADAGSGFNRNFVRGLADGTEALRDWVRQQAAAGRLNQVLDNGAKILSEIADLAATAGELLFDMMADPALASAASTLIDTMRIGLDVLHGFLNVFQALPGPVQGAVTSLVAVGGVAMLLFSRLQLLRGATLAAIDHLTRMGPIGISAANGLERTSRWAGRATVAFAALQVASALLIGNARDLNPQIDALEKSLREFAITGHMTGEAARILGKDMENLGQFFTILADSDNNRRGFVRWAMGAAEAIPFFGEALAKLNPTSVTNTKQRVEALDLAMANMVRSGHGEQARTMFERLAAAQMAQGVSMEELKRQFPQYAAAIEVAGGATAELARKHQMAAMNAAILERGLAGAVKEAGSLRNAFDVLRGATLAWADAEIVAEEAIDNLTDSLRENGKTMDVNSDKGRANKKALLDGVEAAIDAAQAKYDQTVATKGETVALQEANTVYQDYISRLREAMTNAGMKKEKVDELIAAFAAMPQLIPTTVTTPGLDKAIERTRELLRLRGLLGSSAAAARYNPDTFGAYSNNPGYRWGGIRTYHAQTGLLRDAGIWSPKSPARFAFAEPGTGGEAFIPRFGNEDRSMSILQQAAAWYGATVTPAGQMAAMMGKLAAAVGQAAAIRQQPGGGQMIATVYARDGATQMLAELVDVRVEYAMDREASLSAGGPR